VTENKKIQPKIFLTEKRFLHNSRQKSFFLKKRPKLKHLQPSFEEESDRNHSTDPGRVYRAASRPGARAHSCFISRISVSIKKIYCI
jgi:hypothetical protein